jgi:hypothetical protein
MKKLRAGSHSSILAIIQVGECNLPELLLKIEKTEIKRPTIIPIHTAWKIESYTLRKKYTIRMFENKVLRRIFGSDSLQIAVG